MKLNSGNTSSACAHLPSVRRFLPRRPATVHRPDVGVAHFLQIYSRERRAVTAAAIQDEFGVFVGKGLHDIAFDNAACHMYSTGGVSGLKFVVFANVDQSRPAGDKRPGFGDIAFFNLALSVV